MSILSSMNGKRADNSRISSPNKKDEYPIYAKAAFILISLCLIFYILNILSDILIPLGYSFLVAILLNPLVNLMVSKRIPKVVAISLAVILAFLVIAGVTYFISSQMANFSSMLPDLKVRMKGLMDSTQQWIAQEVGYPIPKQNEMISNVKVGNVFSSTIVTAFGVISTFILIPVYTYLLLYYKPLLLNFIYECFDDKNGYKVEQILSQLKGSVQSYVSGLMIEFVIVSLLDALALYLLGVPYALLIGFIGGLLNMIPYIGGIIAIAIPIVISLATQDGLTTPILIFVVYQVIQFIDNYLVVPKVVSSKVSINALVSVIIVLLGNTLWGVSGMFLSIPFIGVMKIIFDRVDGLKPIGKLLGTQMPTKRDPIADHTHEIIDETIDGTTGEVLDEVNKSLKDSGKVIPDHKEKEIKEQLKAMVKEYIEDTEGGDVK